MSDATGIGGSCLCGAVQYSITPPFDAFQFCFCSRCRKLSGSAHGANIFVPLAQFAWLKGEDVARRFELPTAKYWCSGFCSVCGSSLPWLSRHGGTFVVPAGGLDGETLERPRRIVNWASRATWYVPASELPIAQEGSP